MAHSHGLILTWNSDVVAPNAYRGRSVPVLSDKACNMAIGEKVQHGMIETVEQAVLGDHSRQGADNGLGARMDIVWSIRRVGRVIGLCDNSPVTHDEETVEAVASPEGDKLGGLCQSKFSGCLRPC
jgi:hypothetical protein